MNNKSKTIIKRLFRDLLDIAYYVILGLLVFLFIHTHININIKVIKATKDDCIRTEWVKAAREIHEPSAETLGGNADHTATK